MISRVEESDGYGDQRSQTHRADFQQSGLGYGGFDAGSQFAGFFVAVVAFHNGLDGFADGVDQFTPAGLARTDSLRRPGGPGSEPGGVAGSS